MKKSIALLFVLMICACAPWQEKPGEIVLGKGVIKVIDEKRLLIQETTSVVALDYGKAAGAYLSGRYKAGQSIILMGTKTIDEHGNSHETITALVFEDGERFNIVS